MKEQLDRLIYLLNNKPTAKPDDEAVYLMWILLHKTSYVSNEQIPIRHYPDEIFRCKKRMQDWEQVCNLT